MTAIIVLRTQDNPVPDGPGKWYGGQCVVALDGGHIFGYQEMPVTSIQNGTPAQLSTDPDPPTYGAYKILSSGTIVRATGEVVVQQDDVVVYNDPVGPDEGGYVNYGPRTTLPDGFRHFRITDLTKEQAQVYVQPVFDETAPENPVLVSRSKYRVNAAGLAALNASEGWLEGPWADFVGYFEDQYP